jgi:predicted 3-demethylubiquinone-9 3-methyltransferase (glyoxalase superfamily)
VNCRTRQGIDTVWSCLSAGGSTPGCGRLTDKYGVSWRVVPASLGAMLGDSDEEKSRQVMKAMLQMDKMDLGVLKQAYEKG